jgi:hypothetical protein
METEIVAGVVDIARQSAQPAAAEARPDQHAHGGYQQAYDHQKFSEVVHVPGYLTHNSRNRLAKRFHRFMERLPVFQTFFNKRRSVNSCKLRGPPSKDSSPAAGDGSPLKLLLETGHKMEPTHVGC